MQTITKQAQAHNCAINFIHNLESRDSWDGSEGEAGLQGDQKVLRTPPYPDQKLPLIYNVIVQQQQG